METLIAHTTPRVLDYLKVVLAGPVLFSLVAVTILVVFKDDLKALFRRIAKLSIAGVEVSTQVAASNSVSSSDNKSQIASTEPIAGIPDDLKDAQKIAVEHLVRSHKETAYLWEYRYLNYFLAPVTQTVLDWLISLTHPTTGKHFDTVWLPRIPSANERGRIVDALQMHHLIVYGDNDLMQVTPKGHEYQEWRITVVSGSAK